jgi:hypothetical protein
MDAIATPSLLTVNQRHDYAVYKARGYGIMWHQHYNSGPVGPLDTGGDYKFDDCVAAGLDPGVWCVIYQHEDSVRREIARASAARARDLGAEHLMFDIEYNGFDARAIIDGCRDEGWTGAVHLTCLGAPERSPSGPFYDYQYDCASFLATGGGIFPQAYYAPYPTSGRHPNYAAEITRQYYVGQLGIPSESVNMMIWPNGFNAAEVERDKLLEAGLGKAMSIFLAETTSEHAYDVLEAITGATVPPDTDGDIDTVETMAEMAENVRLEQSLMSAKDPEAWIAQNPGEAGEVLRLVVYTAFSRDWPARELKTHAGRASSGIAQNGKTSLEL